MAIPTAFMRHRLHNRFYSLTIPDRGWDRCLQFESVYKTKQSSRFQEDCHLLVPRVQLFVTQGVNRVAVCRFQSLVSHRNKCDDYPGKHSDHEKPYADIHMIRKSL